MYSYIKGTLEEIAEGFIVIDNHGIGYQIQAPANIIDYLPSIGENIKIYTYLHVKEDAMSLFGFITRDDLKIFKLLLGVNGIGPKGALGILSVMSTDDLRFAVIGGDSKAIAKAPGIGAKTAQRIILELKDKLHLEDVFEDKTEITQNIPVSEAKTVKNEAVQALVALGYSSSEALSTLSKIDIAENMTVEEVLKAALKQMAFI
ncbi:MAG: Holliday junction branch migration protein RuvA [Lachnospiraceae bacterium]|nr:Holliday junction branch migration protein RuvA [Lachnospiraceae bacterium]